MHLCSSVVAACLSLQSHARDALPHVRTPCYTPWAWPAGCLATWSYLSTAASQAYPTFYGVTRGYTVEVTAGIANGCMRSTDFGATWTSATAVPGPVRQLSVAADV